MQILTIPSAWLKFTKIVNIPCTVSTNIVEKHMLKYLQMQIKIRSPSFKSFRYFLKLFRIILERKNNSVVKSIWNAFSSNLFP